MAVDQHRTLQNQANGFPQAEGRWARRVIGLGNRAPHRLGSVAIAFEAKAPADYRLYLDNVILRRADGKVVEFYRDGLPEAARAEDRQAVSVKAVPLAEVKRGA